MNKQQRRSPEELRRFKDSIKKHLKVSNFAYHNYGKNTDVNFDMIGTIESSKTPVSIRRHLRQLYMVYECSALEVYLKHIIIEHAGRWREEGVEKLLTETITLAEAYITFGKGDISREHVISHTNTFQSYFSIEKIFTNLYGKTFFSDVAERSRDMNAFDFEDLELSVQYHLMRIFELRNKIVHECNKAPITGKEALNYGYKIFSFIIGMDSLFAEMLPPRPKPKLKKKKDDLDF